MRFLASEHFRTAVMIGKSYPFKQMAIAARKQRNCLNTRNIKFYIAGCILIIAVLFGSIEISTRVVSWMMGKGFTLALHEFDATDDSVIEIYAWHPFTGITFKPNATFTGSHPNQEESAVIHVDEHGFLSNGEKLSYEKPSDEIRIAFIGASTTANINLSYDQNWPGRLGHLVQDVLPQKRVKIINAAVPGFDTAQSLGNLALRVLPFKPDIVIIYHAYNDLKVISPNLAIFKPDYSHVHKKPFGYHAKPGAFMQLLNHSMVYVRTRNSLREYKQRQKLAERQMNALTTEGRLSTIPEEARIAFEEHVRAMVAIAKSAGAKVILSSFATLHNPQLDYDRVESLAQLSTAQKKELIGLLYFTPGLSLPTIFEGINSYNRVLHQIATDEHIGWVDNAVLVPHTDANFTDRVHFTAAGARRMADNFFPVVMEFLQL
jgi:lysophospholipase L1-like esterase